MIDKKHEDKEREIVSVSTEKGLLIYEQRREDESN